MAEERDHRKRLWKLCDDALKQAALGEPYQLGVEFTFAPEVDQQTKQIKGLKPAWFVMVTIPSSLVGQDDVGNGVPVWGVLAPDEAFRSAAVGLLEICRQERAQASMSLPSGDEIMRRLREAKS